MNTTLAWEIKKLFIDRTFKAALLLFVLFSCLSMVYGKTQLQRQHQTLDRLGRVVRESDEVYFKTRFEGEEEMGRAHYYLSQATEHRALPEGALSLGQRDLHSYHQVYRLRSLYGNLFDAGFENPTQSAAGHFDFSFVLVLLLPLVIIANSYDLLSSESERGTLKLLRTSGASIARLLAIKVLVRFGALTSISLALLTLGMLYVQAPLGSWLSWALVLMSYLMFWFGVAAFVMSFAWSTARNAGVYLGIWALLTLVGPTLVSISLPREATLNGAAITITARQEINKGWDRDKKLTLERAIAYDPIYRDAPILEERYTWAWYYAMHDSGDAAVSEQAKQYFEGLEKREEQSFQWSLLLPPVRAQLLFDQLAGTGLTAHIDYCRFVQNSREDMRQKYLPAVFAEKKVTPEELLKLHDELPSLKYTPQRDTKSMAYLLQFLALGLLSGGLGLASISQIEKRLRKWEDC